MTLCRSEGCDRAAAKRGWCNAHYDYWHRTGVEPTGPVHPHAGNSAIKVRDLRLRRFAANLTRRQLAGRAGVTERVVSDLERREHGTTPEVIARLAQVLHCDPTDLIDPP